MFVGQSIDILVNRQNPHSFRSTWPFYWIPVGILLGLGLIFGSVGAGLLIFKRRKQRNRIWLLDFGTPIWANVIGTQQDWRIQVNGQPATVLVATHGHMEFISGPLDNNDLMNIGEHVKILLDPENANKYVFDIHNESFLVPTHPPAPLAEASNATSDEQRNN